MWRKPPTTPCSGARYTDAEPIDIQMHWSLLIPPQEMMFTARWLVPFMNPAERTALLADMQAHAPAPAFDAILTPCPHLDPASGQTGPQRSAMVLPVPGW